MAFLEKNPKTILQDKVPVFPGEILRPAEFDASPAKSLNDMLSKLEDYKLKYLFKRCRAFLVPAVQVVNQNS